MTESVYLAFFALVAAAIAVETWRRHSTPDARRLRGYRKTSATSAAQCLEGSMVRLVGVVEALGPPLRSPVSDQECVGYLLRVVRVGLGDQSEPSRELCEHAEASTFTLRDASGSARIDPGTSVPLIFGVASVARFVFGAAPERVRAILAARGYDRREVGGVNAHLACHEVVVSAGTHASIGGLASWEANPAGTSEVRGGRPFRDAPRALHVKPASGAALVVERLRTPVVR